MKALFSQFLFSTCEVPSVTEQEMYPDAKDVEQFGWVKREEKILEGFAE
jgi:hypothetical protein